LTTQSPVRNSTYPVNVLAANICNDYTYHLVQGDELKIWQKRDLAPGAGVLMTDNGHW
jgi:hypothetical protein